ncbi:hypothetical protein GALMADRAFT_248561 [Galerina marginata CBS 339.88]|uniref:IMS import disulfide relay-system CHCH-CHCH-like Cx9C domain-containing protein n=1 Tax=Galerina marginata (strain CBS 339.88) TaxID=685588 RepID=A0A067T7D8_GALM3|nr:hypothetical protein GALMADRAFT_248561 [Galerina marginata CBS 339.88]
MAPAPIKAATTNQPLKRLARHSTATCATQATAYAKCIVSTYTDVTQDICKGEFLVFKKCLHDAMKNGR